MKKAKSLQDSLLQRQGTIDGERLSSVGNQLDFIGSIPPEIAARVKMLFLSNNNIRTLKGVEQFQQLELLSIANNEIRYLEELYYLKLLPNLRKLSLAGNVVTKFPFYIDFVLGHAPHLEALDGGKITTDHRVRAKVNFRRATQFLSRAISNTIRNSLLYHIVRNRLCQAELSRTVFARLRMLKHADIGRMDGPRVSLPELLRILRGSGLFKQVFALTESSLSRSVQLSLLRLSLEHKQRSKKELNEQELFEQLFARQEADYARFLQENEGLEHHLIADPTITANHEGENPYDALRASLERIVLGEVMGDAGERYQAAHNQSMQRIQSQSQLLLPSQQRALASMASMSSMRGLARSASGLTSNKQQQSSLGAELQRLNLEQQQEEEQETNRRRSLEKKKKSGLQSFPSMSNLDVISVSTTGTWSSSSHSHSHSHTASTNTANVRPSTTGGGSFVSSSSNHQQGKGSVIGSPPKRLPSLIAERRGRDALQAEYMRLLSEAASPPPPLPPPPPADSSTGNSSVASIRKRSPATGHSIHGHHSHSYEVEVPAMAIISKQVKNSLVTYSSPSSSPTKTHSSHKQKHYTSTINANDLLRASLLPSQQPDPASDSDSRDPSLSPVNRKKSILKKGLSSSSSAASFRVSFAPFLATDEDDVDSDNSHDNGHDTFGESSSRKEDGGEKGLKGKIMSRKPSDLTLALRRSAENKKEENTDSLLPSTSSQEIATNYDNLEDEEEEELQAKITAFIAQAKSHPPPMIDEDNIEAIFHPLYLTIPSDNSGDDKGGRENKVLLALLTRLQSSCERLPLSTPDTLSAMPSADMSEARARIADLTRRSILLQRKEHEAHSDHIKCSQEVNRCYRLAMALVDEGIVTLRQLYQATSLPLQEENEEVRRHWLSRSEQAALAYHELRKAKDMAFTKLAQITPDCDQAVFSLASQQAAIAKVTHHDDQIGQVLLSMADQMKIVTKEILILRQANKTIIPRLSLIRAVFTNWRSIKNKLKKIRLAHGMSITKQAMKIKASLFHRWHHLHVINSHGHKVSYHHTHHWIKAHYYHIMIQQYQLASNLSHHRLTRRRQAMRRALLWLQDHVHIVRAERQQTLSRSTCCVIFKLVRIIRVWKRIKREQQTHFMYLTHNAVHRLRLRHVFARLQSVYTMLYHNSQTKTKQVVARQQSLSLQSCWVHWQHILQQSLLIKRFKALKSGWTWFRLNLHRLKANKRLSHPCFSSHRRHNHSLLRPWLLRWRKRIHQSMLLSHDLLFLADRRYTVRRQRLAMITLQQIAKTNPLLTAIAKMVDNHYQKKRLSCYLSYLIAITRAKREKKERRSELMAMLSAAEAVHSQASIMAADHIVLSASSPLSSSPGRRKTLTVPSFSPVASPGHRRRFSLTEMMTATDNNIHSRSHSHSHIEDHDIQQLTLSFALHAWQTVTMRLRQLRLASMTLIQAKNKRLVGRAMAVMKAIFMRSLRLAMTSSKRQHSSLVIAIEGYDASKHTADAISSLAAARAVKQGLEQQLEVIHVAVAAMDDQEEQLLLSLQDSAASIAVWKGRQVQLQQELEGIKAMIADSEQAISRPLLLAIQQDDQDKVKEETPVKEGLPSEQLLLNMTDSLDSLERQALALTQRIAAVHEQRQLASHRLSQLEDQLQQLQVDRDRLLELLEQAMAVMSQATRLTIKETKTYVQAIEAADKQRLEDELRLETLRKEEKRLIAVLFRDKKDNEEETKVEEEEKEGYAVVDHGHHNHRGDVSVASSISLSSANPNPNPNPPSSSSPLTAAANSGDHNHHDHLLLPPRPPKMSQTPQRQERLQDAAVTFSSAAASIALTSAASSASIQSGVNVPSALISLPVDAAAIPKAAIAAVGAEMPEGVLLESEISSLSQRLIDRLLYQTTDVVL